MSLVVSRHALQFGLDPSRKERIVLSDQRLWKGCRVGVHAPSIDKLLTYVNKYSKNEVTHLANFLKEFCKILQNAKAYPLKKVDECRAVCYNDDAFIGRIFKMCGSRKAVCIGKNGMHIPKGARHDAYEYEGVILVDDTFIGFGRLPIVLRCDAAAFLWSRGARIDSCHVKSS